MSTTSSPSIAIIGSGPGGLTLACLLQSSSIPFTLFDLRASPSPSAINFPSGSLDLHVESGLRALKSCGLYEAFLRHTRDDAESTRIADKAGEVHYKDEGNPYEKRPEIDRSRLNHLLLENINPDVIKWGHKLRSIKPSEEERGSWTLDFSGYSPLTFDFVIGADGAWSKVREALTTQKPSYSGISAITLTVPNVDIAAPNVSSTVGRGNLFVCSDGKALMSQRGGLEGDYIRTYCMLSAPSESFLGEEGFLSRSVEEVKSALVTDERFYGDWSDDMKAIITSSSSDLKYFEKPKPLYQLPMGFKWESKPGLTLLGDAAHLMTPFAGEGVNAAMLDAHELFSCIMTAVKWGRWEVVTRKYEASMFKRAKETAEMTLEGKQLIFAEDAPAGFVQLMESHGPPAVVVWGMSVWDALKKRVWSS